MPKCSYCTVEGTHLHPSSAGNKDLFYCDKHSEGCKKCRPIPKEKTVQIPALGLVHLDGGHQMIVRNDGGTLDEFVKRWEGMSAKTPRTMVAVTMEDPQTAGSHLYPVIEVEPLPPAVKYRIGNDRYKA